MCTDCDFADALFMPPVHLQCIMLPAASCQPVAMCLNPTAQSLLPLFCSLAATSCYTTWLSHRWANVLPKWEDEKLKRAQAPMVFQESFPALRLSIYRQGKRLLWGFVHSLMGQRHVLLSDITRHVQSPFWHIQTQHSTQLNSGLHLSQGSQLISRRANVPRHFSFSEHVTMTER